MPVDKKNLNRELEEEVWGSLASVVRVPHPLRAHLSSVNLFERRREHDRCIWKWCGPCGTTKVRRFLPSTRNSINRTTAYCAPCTYYSSSSTAMI